MDLKDKYGAVIARIVESSDKSQRIYDRIGRFKGAYDPRLDQTFDQYGAYFGNGNLLTMLIRADD